MLKAFFALILVFACGSAEAQVCSELFRATPASDAILGKLLTSQDVFVPTQSQVLRAARADVLGNPSLSGKTKQWARRWFAMFEVDRVRQSEAAVEFRRRELTSDLKALGFEARRDFRTVLSQNRPYLTSALALGLNGAVNYLTYRFYGSFDPMIIYVPAVRVFNWRTTPDNVLREMLDPALGKPDSEKPETRAYVKSRLSFLTPHLVSGADIVVRNGRSFAHAAIIAVAVASANPAALQKAMKPLLHPEVATAAADQQFDRIDEGLVRLHLDQNESTLAKAKVKRVQFLKQGNLEKAALMDSVIHDIELENETIRNEPLKAK